MKLCAGTCSYSNKLCTIRLSRPLLKYRPFSDLINTLLHEMIHAYIFLTQKYMQDRSAHGPQFRRMMDAINQKGLILLFPLENASISVFHRFKDEVHVYRRHVWWCTVYPPFLSKGKCKNEPPFYGYVRRSINRPPQKADKWWSTHSKECGGEFVKIQSPIASPLSSETTAFSSPPLIPLDSPKITPCVDHPNRSAANKEFIIID